MLTRKPRKGDLLDSSVGHNFPVREWKQLGTVTHVDGNICHYQLADGTGHSAFIWWFSTDKVFNRLVRIREQTDEGVKETTAGLLPVDESAVGNCETKTESGR